MKLSDIRILDVRRWIALAVLVCTAASPAGGSATIATSSLLDLRHGHRHLASVVREGGHLHLVLSHDEHSHDRSHHSDWSAPHPELGHGSLGHSDHVFELGNDSALNTTSRRGDEAPALVFAVTRICPPTPPAVALTHSVPEPRAADVGRLRTIVLRL